MFIHGKKQNLFNNIIKCYFAYIANILNCFKKKTLKTKITNMK